MAKFFATNRDGDQSMTVFGDGWEKPVAGTHPNFKSILEYLVTTPEAEHNDEYLRGLVDPTVGIGRTLQEHFGDRMSFDMHHLYLDGLPVHGGLATAIKQRMLAADQDWLRFVKFLVNLDENPSKRAKDAVWDWVEKHGVSITEDGRIVGYKGLVRGQDAVTGETDVPVSYHSGPNNFVDGRLYGEPDKHYQVPHRVGSVISKRRSDVDDNNRLACSTGLHVGAYSYAKTFGENRADGQRYSTMGKMASTFALVVFAPQDVVSVPEDNSSDWKIRVSKYEVLEFLNEVQDVLDGQTSYPARVEVRVDTPAPFIPSAEKSFQEPEVPAERYTPPAPVEKSEERKAREADLESLSKEQREVYDRLRMADEPHDEALQVAREYTVEEAVIAETTKAALYFVDAEDEQHEVDVAEGLPSADLTLAENAARVPDLARDLADRSYGHKPLARKWANLTTEASVRRYRKANGITRTPLTAWADAVS